MTIDFKRRPTVNGVAVEPDDPMMLGKLAEGASASVAFDDRAYELAVPGGGTAQVLVRFTILPVSRWHRLDNVTKRRLGIVGGGGVSVLRAGREIAYGWYLMGNDISEQRRTHRELALAREVDRVARGRCVDHDHFARPI